VGTYLGEHAPLQGSDPDGHDGRRPLVAAGAVGEYPQRRLPQCSRHAADCSECTMCDERSIISGIPQNDESLMNPTADEAVHALDRSLRQCDNRTAPITAAFVDNPVAPYNAVKHKHIVSRTRHSLRRACLACYLSHAGCRLSYAACCVLSVVC
jgi:hypothetical protein